jgi:hypothetical protein
MVRNRSRRQDEYSWKKASSERPQVFKEDSWT